MLKFIQVKYGVENYYVPEGEGSALERPTPGEAISLRLVVDKNGNAAHSGGAGEWGGAVC